VRLQDFVEETIAVALDSALSRSYCSFDTIGAMPRGTLAVVNARVGGDHSSTMKTGRFIWRSPLGV
jgi:hypothetical protein